MFYTVRYRYFICLALCLFCSPVWLEGQDSQKRTGAFNGPVDAYDKYASALIKRYDLDKDGFLNDKELSHMRRPPNDADENGDGKISKQELVNAVRGKPRNKRRSSAKKEAEIALGALSDNKIAGAVSGAVLKDGMLAEALRREVIVEKGRRGSINARFDLVEFDNNATLEKARQLVLQINENGHAFSDRLMQDIVERDDIKGKVGIDTGLLRDRTVKLQASSPGSQQSIDWEILLSDSRDWPECRIQLKKSLEKEQSVGSLKNVEEGHELSDIQKAVIEQLQSRRDSRGRRSEAMQLHQNQKLNLERQAPGYLFIDTTIPVEGDGADATLFSHRGRIWMLVARFDVNE